MTDITMPSLSDSMEEGTILKWLIGSGDPVALGDELLEIETDKATMTYDAEVDGILEILAAEGDTLPVGTVIARVGDAAAQAGGREAEAEAETDTPAGRSGREAEPEAETDTPAAAREPDGGLLDGAAHPERLDGRAAGGDERATATASSTPLARRIAAAHGIELGSVAGSGPRGRVTKADVLTAAGLGGDVGLGEAATRAEPWATTAGLAPNGAGGGGEGGGARPSSRSAPGGAPTAPAEPAKGRPVVQTPTRLQALIARRMAEVKATVPEFQVQCEVAMDEAIALRARLKELAADGPGPVPSLNDIIVKACAIALRRHPRVNASYRDEGFELHPRINIGVAVAAEEALVVPTVTDADQKSVGQIARETRRLAERVRSGEISPPELSGATFTVSNLGMFGMSAITPVINLHQAAILGVGAMRGVLTRLDGEIHEATMMTLTLSCDHRILYGADAARFLADVASLLEEPLRIAL